MSPEQRIQRIVELSTLIEQAEKTGHDPILSSADVVLLKIVPYSESSLSLSRQNGGGPPFVKIGGKYAYKLSELMQWQKSLTSYTNGAAIG
jgi:hypothetical protein